nr:AAA family ATPase [Burkholderia sp. Ax-1719]
MFRRYDWIAGILDETHRPLKARICYRKSIVERAIVPFILDTDNECRLNDGSLERERVRVLETRRETQTQIVPPEFVRAVSNFLHSRLSKNGHEHRLIALATLERQIRRVGQRAAVISYFLKAFDLASVSEPGLLEDHSDLARASSDFDKIYESTFNVLAASEHIDTINDRTVEGIEFESNSAIVDIVIRSPNSAVEFSWSDLSSGLLSLIQQFTRLDYAVARLRKSAIKSVLLLIDEADAFLHLDWQRQYVENLNTFLSELKRHHNLDSLQVLIATHSPVISGDFPSPMVQRLDSERSEPFKTFGNSLDSLVFDAFETSSIGSFAAKKIRILRERFLRGELDDEDRALIKEIGDPGLQRAVLKGQAKMAFNIPPSPSGKASD